MSRNAALASGLCVLVVLAGCQTRPAKAETEALADCAKIAEAEKRATCQTEVMTAGGDAERRMIADRKQAAEARGEREALKEALDLPKDARPRT